MSEFTYEIPSEDKFLKAILILLKQNDYNELASLLSDTKVSITKTTSFSRVRWDAYYTIVDFFSAPEQIRKGGCWNFRT